MTETKPASRPAVLAALLTVYIIWGSTYLAIRFAVATLPPFLMAGVRFLIAGALLYAFMRVRGAPRPTRAQWRGAAIIGGCLLLGGNGLVVWAERQGVPSSLTALLISMTPIWMALLNWVRPRGSRPSVPVITGLLLGFGGVALLISPQLQGGMHGASVAGFLIIPLAALSWAIGSIYARTAAVPASPLMGTAIEMLLGGALLSVTGLATGEVGAIHPQAITGVSLLALLYLIIFGSLVAFTAYVWLLRNTPLAIAATYAYVNPVVAVFLGWALAGEQLTLLTLASAAVIIAAVVIITTFRQEAPAPAPPREESLAEPPFAATKSG
jgi:drug/metabolite transporter (DMT)-like permease